MEKKLNDGMDEAESKFKRDLESVFEQIELRTLPSSPISKIVNAVFQRDGHVVNITVALDDGPVLVFEFAPGRPITFAEEVPITPTLRMCATALPNE